MLKSLSKLILLFILSISLSSANAQTDKLVKELRANVYNLSLSSVVYPVKGQVYEVTSSGHVIYFRKGGKLLASINLAKMDYSQVLIIKRSDRMMLQFTGLQAGAYKYFHSSSNGMREDLKTVILSLRNYTRDWQLLEAAQRAVYDALPKRNITLRCRGSAKDLKRVGVTVRVKTYKGYSPFDSKGGRFTVNGSTGTFLIKGIPIGAKIGVWIEYPSEFSSENSDSLLPKPNREFTAPVAVGRGGHTISMSLP